MAARHEHDFAVPLLQLHKTELCTGDFYTYIQAAPEAMDDVPHSVDALSGPIVSIALR